MIASNSWEASFAVLFISYLLSVVGALQDCSRGQDPEFWIPVLSFFGRLGLTAPSDRGLQEWCQAGTISPLAL